jgi:hypothetical protein
MSYSVIYKRFRVIHVNSKLKEILHKSPYMNMDISSENQKMQNLCCKKFGALLIKFLLSKGVNWKKVKDQLRVIELIFIISE